MRASREEVVITGWGVVSPIGVGREAFACALAEGRSGVDLIRSFDPSALPTRLGAEVRDFDAKEHVRPRKSLKVMSRDIQLAFAAADMSWRHAALEVGKFDPERAGVVLGAEFIMFEIDEVAPAFRACLDATGFHYDRWGEQAMSQIYPLWLLKYLPNIAACHLSIALDVRGPNNSIVLGEVSGLLAIGEAAKVIERGWADVMLAGGASSWMHPTRLTYRQRYQLSKREHDPAGAVRPFDADRDGEVHGEGAGVVVLESRRHAEARGARILARVLGHASRYEPQMGGRPRRGTAIRTAIAAALEESGLKAGDIGHVNAHGLSATHNDRIEACAIRDLLGDVPVTAPKSYFGSLGAGGAAVELCASLVAFAEGRIPRTLNYQRPDPECPVRVVHGEPWPVERPAALVLNQSLTGQSAALVLAPV